MAIALKVKFKSGHQVVNDFTQNTTISSFKQRLSELSSIKIERLHILRGFPPTPLDISNNNLTLKEAGLVSGDVLIIEEKAYSPPVKSSSSSEPNHLATNSKGILLKHVVPADNSCLFSSIGYVMNGKIPDGIGSHLRQIIATTVSSDPENYTPAFLSKSNKEYCDWIMKPDTWGGAIEVSILSVYYGIEIAVVDTQNAIINRFGEDKNYGSRVFLLFDGIHYDPLYLERYDGGKTETIFSSDDDTVLENAKELAEEARSARQYTDVNNFTLKCITCDLRLNGQVGAQTHARETGHTDFGEI